MTDRLTAILWTAALAALLTASDAASQGRLRTISLAWDRNPEPNVAGYLVYVGTSPLAPTQIFDAGNQTTFTFPLGILGLRYYFSVAAYTHEQLIGPRSVEVDAVAGASLSVASLASAALNLSTDLPASTTPPAGGSPASTPVVCVESRPAPCFARRVLAAGLDEIGAAGSTGLGSVFFIEGGRQVRLMRGDGLAAAPVLTAQTGTRLSGLVIDPAYAHSRFVFVGIVDERASAARQLSVVRYRDVGETLGEPAVILSGLRLDGHDPRIAVDTEGHLYVAMPAIDGSRDLYASHVLRFRADGSAVEGGVGRTPVWGRGYASPTGLATSAETLWVSGTDPAIEASLVAMSLRPSSAIPHERWSPLHVPGDVVAGPATVIRSFDRDAAGRLVYIDADGGVWWGGLAVDGVEATRIDWPGDEQPVMARFGVGDEWFVGVRVADGSFALVELKLAK